MYDTCTVLLLYGTVYDTVYVPQPQTLQSELHLLKSDLAWLEKKFIYKPKLLANIEVINLVSSLKTRIGSYEGLLSGGITKEFEPLTPYSASSELTIQE